jgi:exodeoxyribonuclease VII large subunit
LRIARTRALIERVSVQLRTAISDRVRFEQRTVDVLGSRLAAQAPSARAAAARAAIAVLGPRMERAVRTRLNAERISLLNLEKRLRSAGPEETLARGYSIVTTSAGALVRSTHDVRVGDRLSIVVADGTVGARVEVASEPPEKTRDTLQEAPDLKASMDRGATSNHDQVGQKKQKNLRRKKSGESSA